MADWSKEAARLSKEARKLAKRANQRMVRLERYAQQDKYKGVLEYAYKGAQKDIGQLKRMLGQNVGKQMRFREAATTIKGMSDKEMVNFYRMQISASKRFLDAASSTLASGVTTSGAFKPGINYVYDQRTATINARFGTNFTPEELQRFFNSRKQASLEKEYGSKNMFKIADTIKQMGKGKRDMKEYLKNNITLKNYEIHEDQYKDAKDMYEQLSPYLKDQEDPILNAFVSQAVEEGFTSKLLGFII